MRYSSFVVLYMKPTKEIIKMIYFITKTENLEFLMFVT